MVRLILIHANNIVFTLKIRLFLYKIVILLSPLFMLFIFEIKDFIFQNYFKRIGFSKENSYHLMKRLKRKIYCSWQTN